MGKNIQMPVSFVTDVARLLLWLTGTDTDDNVKTLCESLDSQIQAKLNAMDRRKSFCAYKTAEKGSDERETYRREYLDKAGILKDWQSDTEIKYENI